MAFGQKSTLGSIERLDPAFDQLVPAGSQLDILARGFTWTEGPCWMGDEDGHLLFSDIPRNAFSSGAQRVESNFSCCPRVTQA